MKRNRLHLVLLVAVGLGGCATTPPVESPVSEAWPPGRYYEEGKRALDAAEYDTAISNYAELRTRYPDSAYAQQAELEIAYAHYKSGEPERALELTQDFIRRYPTHRHLAYAYYLRALVSFEQGLAELRAAPPGEPKAEDVATARQAFEYLTALTIQFPDSPYTRQATQYLVALHNAMAEYHTRQAEAALAQGRYKDATRRANYVVENFPNAPSLDDALGVLAMGYAFQSLEQPATAALERLKQLDPSHPAIARARALNELSVHPVEPPQDAEIDATDSGGDTELSLEPESDGLNHAEASAPSSRDAAEGTVNPVPAKALATSEEATPHDESLPLATARDQSWLLTQDPSLYTLQLLTTRSVISLRRYIQLHGIQENAAYFPTVAAGRTHYVLLYGSYDSLEAAREAIKDLPEQLSGSRPWIRSMAAVQKLITEARQAETSKANPE